MRWWNLGCLGNFFSLRRSLILTRSSFSSRRLLLTRHQFKLILIIWLLLLLMLLSLLPFFVLHLSYSCSLAFSILSSFSFSSFSNFTFSILLFSNFHFPIYVLVTFVFPLIRLFLLSFDKFVVRMKSPLIFIRLHSMVSLICEIIILRIMLILRLTLLFRSLFSVIISVISHVLGSGRILGRWCLIYIMSIINWLVNQLIYLNLIIIIQIWSLITILISWSQIWNVHWSGVDLFLFNLLLVLILSSVIQLRILLFCSCSVADIW